MDIIVVEICIPILLKHQGHQLLSTVAWGSFEASQGLKATLLSDYLRKSKIYKDKLIVMSTKDDVFRLYVKMNNLEFMHYS